MWRGQVVKVENQWTSNLIIQKRKHKGFYPFTSKLTIPRFCLSSNDEAAVLTEISYYHTLYIVMLCISKFVYIQHQFETFDLFTLLDGKMQSWSFFRGQVSSSCNPATCLKVVIMNEMIWVFFATIFKIHSWCETLRSDKLSPVFSCNCPLYLLCC